MAFKIGLAKKRKEFLESELRALVSKVIEIGVEKVILFGSLTKNSVHKASDIDLIILKQTDKKFLDRSEFFYQRLKPRVATDILVYTPEEFEEMKQDNQFIKSVLKDGKVLYEKNV